MVRSILAVGMTAALFISVGCDANATKQMAEKATETASAAAAKASDSAGDLMGSATAALAGVEGGSEMLKQITEMFGKVTETLGTVKDADTATAALPDITKLTDGFGGMTEMFGKMPDAAKSAVAGVIKSSIEQLKPIIEKALAIPGVEAVLKPAMDALMGKLEAFKV